MKGCGISKGIIRSNLNDVIDHRTRENRITLDNSSAPVNIINHANNHNHNNNNNNTLVCFVKSYQIAFHFSLLCHIIAIHRAFFLQFFLLKITIHEQYQTVI